MQGLQVFLGWSGPRSKAVALALHEWLPNVIQEVVPWMSTEDIEKGAKWSEELAAKLTTTNFGIICVTPEAQHAPWLLFEAGALSKALTGPPSATMQGERVATLLFEMTSADVSGPLAHFQHTDAQREDILRLIISINGKAAAPLGETKLNSAFDKWWPDLEGRFQTARRTVSAAAIPRKDRELLEEILLSVRATDRVAGVAPITGMEEVVVPSWFEDYVRSSAINDVGNASMGIAIQERFMAHAETVLSAVTCPLHKVSIRSNIMLIEPGRAQVSIQACCMFAVLIAARRVLGYVDVH